MTSIKKITDVCCNSFTFIYRPRASICSSQCISKNQRGTETSSNIVNGACCYRRHLRLHLDHH